MKNFHSHNYRCGHASGDTEDYARYASAQGLEALGISDHTPLPDARLPDIRMPLDALPGYVGAVRASAQQHPDLRIYCGLECEYDADYVNFYKDEVLGRQGVDYLFCGMHFYPDHATWVWSGSGASTKKELRQYAEFFVTSMQKDLFLFMAHPDLFATSRLTWDNDTEASVRYMLDAAAALQMPLELNTSGWIKHPVGTQGHLRAPYPLREYWELVSDYSIPVVVNTDAHRPEDVTLNLQRGLDMAADLNLRLVDVESMILQRKDVIRTAPLQESSGDKTLPLPPVPRVC